jgi:hypothetical protein
MADARRDEMLGDISKGAGAAGPGEGSGVGKRILIRGCDPVMAEKSKDMLPPLLGGAEVVPCTDDDTFEVLLGQGKWDAVMLAPGACRWSAAGQRIPGTTDKTSTWKIENYEWKVKEVCGDGTPFVATAEEAKIVPTLRASLGLE